MKKIVTAFIAIALLTIGTIFISAQDGEGRKFRHGFGHRRGFERIAKKLDLSDEQKDQVKQILDAGKTRIQPIKKI